MEKVIEMQDTAVHIGDAAAEAIKTIDARRNANAVEPSKANTGAHNNVMTPMEMVGRALEMGVSADILKQMMDLRDREEARNAKIAFTRAVAAAKAEIRPIMKTREVDYTPVGKARVNYRHEDMAGIEEQVTPILAKHGLSYRFESDNGVDRPITITCVLEHVDGHATRTPLSSGADTSGGKNSLQAIASAATYLQRYTLKLALGLSVSHDDDGMKSDGLENGCITQEQVTQIQNELDKVNGDIVKFCAYFKIDALVDLPLSKFNLALNTIRQSAKRAAS